MTDARADFEAAAGTTWMENGIPRERLWWELEAESAAWSVGVVPSRVILDWNRGQVAEAKRQMRLLDQAVDEYEAPRNPQRDVELQTLKQVKPWRPWRRWI